MALALASLLCLLARWPLWLRVGGAALFAAAAALAKEVAFVLPGLALLLLFARPVDDPATTRRLRLLAPAAMVMALGGVLAAHVAVIGGIGGYSEYPWGFVRAVGVGADYVVAAASPPQLELTRQPLLLVVPALVLAALAWRIRVLWRRDERERLRIVGLGAVWFALAALPTLNLAIDRRRSSSIRRTMTASRRWSTSTGPGCSAPRDSPPERSAFGAHRTGSSAARSRGGRPEKRSRSRRGTRSSSS